MILQNFASSLKFIFKKSKMESLERGADMFKRSDLVRLIIPLIIEQILAATIGVADTFMVSSVGEAAMSGVSLVDTINILLLQVFAALATGGAIVVSQYLGKEDGENANIAAKQLVIVVTLLSLVLMAACLVWKVPLLDALFGSAEPEVMENARTYFAISAVSYPLIAIYNGCAALFRAGQFKNIDGCRIDYEHCEYLLQCGLHLWAEDGCCGCGAWLLDRALYSGGIPFYTDNTQAKPRTYRKFA